MKYLNRIAFLIVVGLALGSCSNLTKTLKNPNIDEKYKAAIEYYNSGDYYRAGMVFEDLIPNMMGKSEAEIVQFYYAYCHYRQGQYDLAEHYFKSFYDTYRRSDYAEEALFMHCQSLFEGTPKFNLDQSNTDVAIEAFQDFLNRFPDSNYLEQANDAIKSLRENLELKAYTIAKQYHKLKRYKAAVVAMENFQRDFPDSDYKEEVNFLMIESQYDLAKISIQNLKKERYEKALEYYYSFVDRYPNTKFSKPAENIFENSQKQLLVLNPEVSAKVD